MMNETWPSLVPFKGKFFDGQWPTISEMFSISLSQFPNNKCFSSLNPESVSYTYSEVYSYIQKAASFMIENGISKGDKVLLCGKNSVQWGIAYFAINYCGAVAVPVDCLISAEKCAALAEFAECKYVIADSAIVDGIKETSWYSTVKGTLLLKKDESETFEIMSVEASKIYEPVKISDEDLAVLLFTSGTTGNEKAAMLTNRNIVSDAYLVANGMGCTEKDTLYALLPLHHSYCCTTVLLCSVLHGAECLFGKDISITKMVRDMKNGHVTIFMGIPLIYNKMLAGIKKTVREKGNFAYLMFKLMLWCNGICKEKFHFVPFQKYIKKNILSKLGLENNNFLICGAGPLSAKVFKRFNQLGLDFVQGYGLTECSPVVTLNPKDHFKVSSIGKALKELDVIVADKDSSGVGEIRVKGPIVSSGYYKEPDKTAELFDENGYLKTGDLARVDSEGYFFICGRAKNIIVTDGGKNVYPEEIEDMFQNFLGVEQILVRGYQADKKLMSEKIEAVILPSSHFYKGKSNEEIRKDIEFLVASVNENLPIYKRIDKITITDEKMEETTTKKIKRNKVTGK